MVINIHFNLLQVNPDMVARFEKAGLSFTGKDDTGRRMEVQFFIEKIIHLAMS